MKLYMVHFKSLYFSMNLNKLFVCGENLTHIYANFVSRIGLRTSVRGPVWARRVHSKELLHMFVQTAFTRRLIWENADRIYRYIFSCETAEVLIMGECLSCIGEK